MTILSPEQWLAAGIAFVFLIIGLRVLKQAAAKKEIKYPNFFLGRGGAISLLIMAAIAVSWILLADPLRRTAAGGVAILLFVNGIYWFIRRVSFDLREARRNRPAKSENN